MKRCLPVTVALLAACGGPTPGMPPPPRPVAATFQVDPKLQPATAELAPGRRLAAVRSSDGAVAQLVMDELIVSTNDRAALDGLLERWHGTLVDTLDLGDGEPLYLVRIDPTTADVSQLRVDLAALSPQARGDHALSDSRALSLLAAGTHEARQQGALHVGFNFIMEPQGIVDRTSAEAPTGSGGVGSLDQAVPYTPNAFAWHHIGRKAAQRFGVDAAWHALQQAGKLGNKVPIMVMDQGFIPNADFPAARQIFPENAWSQRGSWACGGGGDCSWHGTQVVGALMGQLDNRYGGAGPAAPVGELIAVQSPAPDLWHYAKYFFLTLDQGLSQRPRIINISATTAIPGAVSWAVDGVIGPKLKAAQQNFDLLIFASAGNELNQIDGEDCLGDVVCVEGTYYFPCEAAGVVCVGGLDYGQTVPAASPPRNGNPGSGSNMGKQQRRREYGLDDPKREDSSIDLYGPYYVWSISPAVDGRVTNHAQLISGTSFAAPFVAGIAALVWAADPTLTSAQVFARLLATAHEESYPVYPARLVPDAYAAVRMSLGNTPPTVVLKKPTPVSSVFADVPVDFEAIAYDADDGAGCCTLTWTSSLTGTLFTGEKTGMPFTTLGQHVITVTATDSEGLTGSVSFTLEVKSSPPSVEITAPVEGELVYRGLTYQVKGSARDGLTVLPCTWGSDSSNESFTPASAQVGCAADVTFIANGTRTLTLSATNKYGFSATVSKTFLVVDPPQNFAQVTIASPGNGAVFYGQYTQTLTGSAQYGNATAVPGSLLRWSKTVNGTTTVLGTGSSVTHTFGLGFTMLTLEALNQNNVVVGARNIGVTFYSNIP